MELNAGGDPDARKIAGMYKEYQSILRGNNALDFDDLIVKTVELFQYNPDILDYYQERFKYIMVDEYQDTNTAQFKFVSLLAEKYKNLCVVGDDDQSIYRFRGANIGNILGFEKVFPESKVVRLEQNYRSTQNILDAANSVISNNVGRKDKRLWTDNGAGDRITFEQLESGFEEADYVARSIARLVRKGEARYKDCAVLYRTNAQSRLFEEKFIAANIPYKIVGGVNFYARKEIKDILAYLKTIDEATYKDGNIVAIESADSSARRVDSYYVDSNDSSAKEIALRDGNGVSYKVVKGQVIAKTPFIGYLSQLCFSAVGIIVTVVIFAAGVAIMMYVNKISKEINTMVEQQTA